MRSKRFDLNILDSWNGKTQWKAQCVGWNLKQGTGSITTQGWGTGPPRTHNPMRDTNSGAGCLWLMPVRRLLSGGLCFKASPGKKLRESHDKNKNNDTKGPLEWHKV
jgi:hypothetical protein